MSELTQTQENTTNDHLSEQEVRLSKLNDLRKNNINPFSYSYEITHNSQEILEKYTHLETGENSEDKVSVAGRLIAKRGHGKATFGNLQDNKGKLQYYANLNALGQDNFDQLLNLDVGDFIGITGTPFRTKRGEYQLKYKPMNYLQSL